LDPTLPINPTQPGNPWVEPNPAATLIINILKEIGFKGIKLIMIYTNSKSTIKLSQNQQFHARTKHINIKCHWIYEAIANSKIKLQYMYTSKIRADVLTKALGKTKFDAMMDSLGLKP
jgi:hypothetical protein